MLLTLPKTIVSAQDLAELQTEVKTYASWYAHESIRRRFSNKAPKTDQPALSAAANELLRQWFGSKTPNRVGFDSLQKALDQHKKTAERITITLAATAPNSLKGSLTEWFRQNVSSSALINFQINSTILGGMVVRRGSRVFDWSFKRQILDNQAAFAKVLRRV